MKHWRWLAIGVLAVAGLAFGVNAPAGHAGPRASALWAVVNVDGTLARGSGVVAAGKIGADGTYFVTFGQDVTGCSYQATSGGALPFTPDPDDAIVMGVAPYGEGGPGSVDLIEYDAILARDSYSSGFHLLVTC